MADDPKTTPCIGADPACPCQDGDACHYREAAGTPAWPVQETADLPAPEEWRDAVLDAMVCWEMWPKPGETARDALRRLLAMEQMVALDPAVSSEARSLIERGRQEASAR